VTPRQAQALGVTFDEWSRFGDQGRALNTAGLAPTVGGGVALVGSDVWAIVSSVRR